MTVYDRLLYPLTAGANVFCIASQRGTAGITVNSPPDAVWEAGSPVSFDVDFSAAGYAFINWDHTLEAWWRFENEGTFIKDWSGNGHNLYYAGTYTPGAFGGYALNPNGTNKAYTYYRQGCFPFYSTGIYTISLWAKLTSTGSMQGLVYFESYKALKISLSSTGAMLVGIWDQNHTAYSYAFSTGAFPVGDSAYHHYAAVIDFPNGTVSHYIDGVFDSTDAIGYAIAPIICYAAWLGSDNYYANGALDEVLVFSRGLSAAEITALYAIAAGNLTTTFAVTDGDIHKYDIVHVGATGAVVKTAPSSLLIDTA